MAVLFPIRFPWRWRKWRLERPRIRIRRPVSPAPSYRAAGELTIISAYFNPAHFAQRRRNFDRFLAPITKGGVSHVTVECATGEDSFELPAGPGVVQVRARDSLWQKERLLNIALKRLPPSCRFVAWLDADVLFENENWAAETCALLGRFAIVQPFTTAILLPREAEHFNGRDGVAVPAFCSLRGNPKRRLRGLRWHGGTGHAWAARREILDRHGFYDADIIGGADHHMAHGFFGGWESATCRFHKAPRHRDHFIRWARAISADVDGRTAAVPGACLHLWHGEAEDRRYPERNEILAACDFDPEADLRIEPSGCWAWASDKPRLHAWVRDYFARRREDG